MNKIIISLEGKPEEQLEEDIFSSISFPYLKALLERVYSPRDYLTIEGFIITEETIKICWKNKGEK